MAEPVQSASTRNQGVTPLQQLETLRGHLAFLGTSPIPADRVLTVLEPVIRALAVEARSGCDSQYLSLSKARTQSRMSESYFRAPLKLLGGKSRLEVWAEQGYAHQEGRQWFVSVAVVPDGSSRSIPRKRHIEASTDERSGRIDPDELYRNLNQSIQAA